MKKCLKCNEPFSGRRPEAKYCSNVCARRYYKSQYRKRYPNKVREWKQTYYGGKKHLGKREKDSALERFDNKCFRCNTNSNLVVHHIKPMSKGGDHTAKNLMVFCDDCHKLWHKKVTRFWIKADKIVTEKETEKEEKQEEVVDIVSKPLVYKTDTSKERIKWLQNYA